MSIICTAFQQNQQNKDKKRMLRDKCESESKSVSKSKSKSKDPLTVWHNFIDFCRKKYEKMEEFEQRITAFEQDKANFNNITYDRETRKTMIKQFNQVHYRLYGDIDHFNRTMSLPSIKFNQINLLLTDLL